MQFREEVDAIRQVVQAIDHYSRTDQGATLDLAETLDNGARPVWQRMCQRASVGLDGYHVVADDYAGYLERASTLLKEMAIQGDDPDKVKQDTRTRDRLARSFNTHAVFATSLKYGGLAAVDRAHADHVAGRL